MSNRVRVSAHFSFKGKIHHPEMRIDLDELLAEGRQAEDLYPLLATRNGYDHYSYEYEMLQAEPLIFDEAQGLVREYLKDGRIDWKGLEKAWQETRLLEQISRIAREHMAIETLEDIPGLKETLLAVYSAAK